MIGVIGLQLLVTLPSISVAATLSFDFVMRCDFSSSMDAEEQALEYYAGALLGDAGQQ